MPPLRDALIAIVVMDAPHIRDRRAGSCLDARASTRRLVRRGCLCLSAKGLKSKVAKEDDGQTVAEVRCGADADRHRTVGRGRVASPRVIC